tara:strand:+ start:4654 stop:5106 length:453 start_codon:yes stop_codon:yes gene_type:complete
MIYWFTGQPAQGKSILSGKLWRYLNNNYPKTRHFVIDGDDLRNLLDNKDYSEQGRRTNMKVAQGIASYLNDKHFDVLVALVSPYRDLREDFKSRWGNQIREIYVHSNRKTERDKYRVPNYQKPLDNYISIDTSKDSVEESFKKLKKELEL